MAQLKSFSELSKSEKNIIMDVVDCHRIRGGGLSIGGKRDSLPYKGVSDLTNLISVGSFGSDYTARMTEKGILFFGLKPAK